MYEFYRKDEQRQYLVQCPFGVTKRLSADSIVEIDYDSENGMHVNYSPGATILRLRLISL